MKIAAATNRSHDYFAMLAEWEADTLPDFYDFPSAVHDETTCTASDADAHAALLRRDDGMARPSISLVDEGRASESSNAVISAALTAERLRS